MSASSYWAILIAAVVSFAFGALWYGLLSRPWMEARGLTESDLAKAKSEMGPIPWPHVLAFIAELIMAWMLAGILLHMAQGGLAASVRTGVISAFFLWFGFVLTTLTVNHAFQGARRMLTVIDGGHWLGVLLIQGAILGWWGMP